MKAIAVADIFCTLLVTTPPRLEKRTPLKSLCQVGVVFKSRSLFGYASGASIV
jgi:hypothetical protein